MSSTVFQWADRCARTVIVGTLSMSMRCAVMWRYCVTSPYWVLYTSTRGRGPPLPPLSARWGPAPVWGWSPASTSAGTPLLWGGVV